MVDFEYKMKGCDPDILNYLLLYNVRYNDDYLYSKVSPDKEFGFSYLLIHYDGNLFNFSFDGSMDDFIKKGLSYCDKLHQEDPERWNPQNYVYHFLKDNVDEIKLIRDRNLKFSAVYSKLSDDVTTDMYEASDTALYSVSDKYYKYHMFVGENFFEDRERYPDNVYNVNTVPRRVNLFVGYFRNVHEFVHDLESVGQKILCVSDVKEPYPKLKLSHLTTSLKPLGLSDDEYTERLKVLMESQYKVGFRDVLSDEYGEGFVRNGLLFPENFSHKFSSNFIKWDDLTVDMKSDAVPGLLYVHKQLNSGNYVPQFDDGYVQKVRIDGMKVANLLGLKNVQVDDRGVLSLSRLRFYSDKQLSSMREKTMTDGTVRFNALLYGDMYESFYRYVRQKDIADVFSKAGIKLTPMPNSDSCFVSYNGNSLDSLGGTFYFNTFMFDDVGEAVCNMYNFFKYTDFDKRASYVYNLMESAPFERIDGMHKKTLFDNDNAVLVHTLDDVKAFYASMKPKMQSFLDDIDSLYHDVMLKRNVDMKQLAQSTDVLPVLDNTVSRKVGNQHGR